jgi:Tol biopolymer transport system component
LYVVQAAGGGLQALPRSVPRTWPDRGSVTPSLSLLDWTAEGVGLIYMWTLVREGEGNPDWVYGDVFSIDVEGTDVERLARLQDVVIDPQLSPDSEQIAYEDENGWIGLLELDTGIARSLGDPNATDGQSGLIAQMDWLTADRLVYVRVAYTTDYDRLPDSIGAVDVDTGVSDTLVAAIDGSAFDPTVMNDGRSLAYVTSTGERQLTVHVLELDSLAESRYPVPRSPGAEISSLALSSS